MSQRGKRQPNRTEDGPVPTKRRKCRPMAAEEEEAAAMAAAAAAGNIWTPRPLSDLKISSIYNRSATEAPAELFRKDLISAMKLPDSEPLGPDEYWVISDQWKQEWERGVQVPVNPDSLPEPSVTVSHAAPSKPHHEFKLPKAKYIRITKDESFNSDEHFLSSTPTKAEKACSYDLDDCDIAWLHVVNGERACMGLQPISEEQFERVIEELELRCWEKVQAIVKTEEGLGIEYDENVICDVCRSPDSEEGNEMVFCDCCNICVHQACYGIMTIPSGSWLCRTCALGQRPECVLCPNKGGAMKCTRSGQKWAHVSCALWIPEVSIGCVERMEPITKISSIPQSRWALICVLCRERVGACIQCSVKTCKTAYHVTCAFKHGLEMKAIIEDENADDGVKLRSYCQKHSVTSKKEKSGSASEDDESKRKKRKDMTSEEKNQARAAKLQEIEAEFDKHVSAKDVTQHIDVDTEGIHFIYNYWKLKRKAGFNKPLLPPKSEDVDILSRQQEQADLEKMKMFVQLRQDLERVRNLCYMVSRREKLSRSFFRMREQTFHKQVAVLSDTSCNLKSKEVAAVIEANHGPSIYDRLYSQPSAPDHGQDFDLLLARIAGITSPTPPTPDLNGLVKLSTDKKATLDNPYRRLYVNGASSRRRSSLYTSMSSASESDSPAQTRLGLGDSTEDEEKPRPRPSEKKTCTPKKNSVSGAKNTERRRGKKPISRVRVDTSSEEDEKPTKSLWQSPRSRTLRQMEREMVVGSASDDSDELLPIKASSKSEPHKINTIYSDSDSDVSLKREERNEDKSSSNTASDSQQHVLRTKAAMKEFSAGIQSKVDKTSSQKNSTTKHSKQSRKNKEVKLDDSMDDDFIKDKENVKSSRKKEYDPTDLIVPQRQAAKKATENIRCSQSRKEQTAFEQDVAKTSPVSEEPKVKQKTKIKSKDIREGKGLKSSDIYDFEKDSSDAQEILAYVPQRQAAKKAAAHIKSGMTKPVGAEVDSEAAKSKKEITEPPKAAKKELDFPKSKRQEAEPEKPKAAKVESKRKSTSKSRDVSSSSSSSSSGVTSSTSSESEEEIEKSKSPRKDKGLPEKRPQVASPLKETDKKAKQKSSGDWPFLDKGVRSPISSSSDSDPEPYRSKKGKSDPTPRTMDSNSKLADKKLRKAPDKKLKTSDGRPEPEFQPPIIERNEPPRTVKEKVGRGRKSDTPARDGDRLGSPEGRSRNFVGSKDGDGTTTTTKRNRSRTPRTEEPAQRGAGTRESEFNKKEQQPRLEGRKRKSGDGPEEPASMQCEGDHDSGATGATAERCRPKERGKSSDHLHTTPKKTTKKVNEVVHVKEDDRKCAKDSKKTSALQPKAVDKELSDTNKGESLARKLEREIAERKAERESSGKKTSKSSLDKLFEKRDKKMGKLFNVKNSTAQETVPSKMSPTKESKREDVERQSSSKDEVTIVKEKLNRDSSTKRSSTHDVSPKVAEKEKGSEMQEGRRNRNSVDKDGVLEKPNSVITSHTGKSSSKDTVIKKTDKDVSSPVKESRRESMESTEAVDDKTRKKTKPMPRCRKKALGILTDADGSQEDKPNTKAETTVSVNVSETNSISVEARVQHTVKKEVPAAVPPAVVDTKSSLPEVDPSSILASRDNMAPALSPGPGPQEALPENKPVVSGNNFTLMPQLEKALDLGHDFQVPEQEMAEPKKISSRTSSLTVPGYQHRSIFSPQQPSKDATVADLLDFENEILAVDETVNDDGFNISRESEEIMRAPLTFSFGNDFLFKEDSKEDSARETLNLVEKLRLEYAKKTTTSANLSEVAESVLLPTVPDDGVIHLDELADEKHVEPPQEPRSSEHKMVEPKVEDTIGTEGTVPEESVLQNHEEELPKEKPEVPSYQYDYQCTVQLDVQAKASLPGREKLDRSSTAQADERWVPPSMDFVPQPHLLLSQHHYESHAAPPMDCTPAPSPYTDLRSRAAKWADSEVLPVRRSSSSSASSSSSSSHREDMESGKRDDLHLPPHTQSGADLAYQGLHPGIPPYPPCSLTDAPPYHPYSEATPFVGPVTLFPPACAAQIPFPSPGTAMFPPPFGPPFATAHTLLPPVPKPPEDPPHMPPPCTAAFTSSSHNMAFTAAMVSPPAPVPTANLLPPEPSPVLHQEPPLTPAPFTAASEPIQQLPVAMSPNNQNLLNHHQPHTPAPPPPPLPAPKANVAGKKSPAKPTRTSARFISQQTKSPGKSPGKSPRQQQQDAAGKTPARVRESAASKRSGGSKVVNRAVYPRGTRRGRGRGRAQQHFAEPDFNTIQSKLAGTVYDPVFDDDSPGESVENLRAMRERRRSTDVHHDMQRMKTVSSESSSYLSRDSSQSPKFASPPHQQVHSASSKLRTSYGTEVRELRPPTPVTEVPAAPTEEGSLEQFPDVVQPLLPGPVDMRTYSSSYEPNPSNNPTTYHNHLLGTFSAAATEQHVPDLEEDIDKELHSVLAGNSVSAEGSKGSGNLLTAIAPPDVTNNKVSLTDSRNQLKVKIKGPFLDANYAASTVAPLSHHQPTLPLLAPLDVGAVSSAIPAASTAMSSAASSGTSNLRRMRKKELLRQYCSQDMNMDDPAGGSLGQAVAPMTLPPVSRAVITIPKAVASMTSIPTREDYKAVVDANMEKKRRKEKSSLSSTSLSVPRELRHLDIPLGDGLGPPERRRSVGSTGSNASATLDPNTPLKRRGRPPKTSATSPGMIVLAPKLKIKIGNSIIGPPETETNLEEKRLRVRPPKKRLSSVQMPSVEELKRESMKFRRMIMADFDEKDKKKQNRVVGGKKKKQRQAALRSHPEVIVKDEHMSTKLIIRLNKRGSTANCAVGEITEGVASEAADARTSLPLPASEAGPPPPSKDKDTRRQSVGATPAEKEGAVGAELLNVRTSKVTPIRLKLSRCQEGYVMKNNQDSTNSAQPPDGGNSSSGNSSSTLTMGQGCEVR